MQKNMEIEELPENSASMAPKWRKQEDEPSQEDQTETTRRTRFP